MAEARARDKAKAEAEAVEADALGKAMAHAYTQELNQVAPSVAVKHGPPPPSPDNPTADRLRKIAQKRLPKRDPGTVFNPNIGDFELKPTIIDAKFTEVEKPNEALQECVETMAEECRRLGEDNERLRHELAMARAEAATSNRKLARMGERMAELAEKLIRREK